ncbi:ROK family protein [Nanoarchaeota archaeon]
MDREYLVGVDLSPERIEAGLVDLNGKVIKKIIIPTEAKRGKKKVIDNISFAVRKIEKSRVLGVGVAIPGMVNKEKGLVLDAELPGWQNINLKKMLEEKLNIPVYIESVGNCFTLAEYKCAHDRKTENMIGVVLNERVHAGIILDSKLVRGSTNAAGAVAHTTIESNGAKCDCGNKGCMQAHVSIPAIERAYKQKTKKNKNFEDISKDSTKPAKDIIKSTGELIGVGFANMINTLNPEVIMVTGPVANNKQILDFAQKEMSKRVLNTNKKVRIVKSRLDDAGILGAASIVM